MFKNIKEIADKEGIELGYSPFQEKESHHFITLMMMEPEDRKAVCLQIAETENPSIFLIAYKRWLHYGMQEKIALETLLLVDLFARGVPGRAVMILIDMLNIHEDTGQIVTFSEVINLYPMGFYDDNTFKVILDGYVKTGLLRNFDIY